MQVADQIRDQLNFKILNDEFLAFPSETLRYRYVFLRSSEKCSWKNSALRYESVQIDFESLRRNSLFAGRLLFCI